MYTCTCITKTLHLLLNVSVTGISLTQDVMLKLIIYYYRTDDLQYPVYKDQVPINIINNQNM